MRCRSASSSRSAPATRCAPARTARRARSPPRRRPPEPGPRRIASRPRGARRRALYAPPMPDGSKTLHSTSHVRTANAVQVVHLLRDRGALSRAELVRASGLTKPTVMAIVKSLIEDGIAIESGTSAAADGDRARGGRPGPLVWFNSGAKTAVAARFGLQFELTHVTAAGAVLAETVLPTVPAPDRFLALARREIRGLAEGSGTLGS